MWIWKIEWNQNQFLTKKFLDKSQFWSFLLFADQAHNVTIHNKEMSLRAGAQHEFTCEALGSRPAAVITWWLDDFQIQPELDDIQIVRQNKELHVTQFPVIIYVILLGFNVNYSKEF